MPLAWQPEIGTAPVVEITRDGLLGVHRTHLAVLAQTHPEARDALNAIVRTIGNDLDRETEPLGWKLRPYQHEARSYIMSRRGTLLADQMRLGKTITTVASHDPDSGPLVIVGPLAARAVWLKEIARRWPGQETVVLKGRKYDPSVLEGPKAIFVHYDILRGWQSLGARRLKIGTLAFDEAHTLSNYKSARTQAALLLSARAERVVAMTGTPLWNKPEGIWGLLACIVPGAFGKYHDFAYRYCKPVMTAFGNQYTGSSNEEEFRLRMTEVMIRREWTDVKADLPPVERSVETVDITEKQAYDLEVAAERLRQANDKQTTIGEIARLRRLLAAIKMGPAVDAACRVVDGGEPVVVWAWHRDIAHSIAEEIAKQGHDAHCISGDEGIDTRELTIERWKAGPPAALVATIPVGQVAIDLSHARQAIYAEVDWTPAMIAQSEMRVFSPDRPMSISYIVADHDVDRSLVNALQAKCATALAIGVPAADTTVDVIANAFGIKSSDAGNLDRLMSALLAGRTFDADEDEDWKEDS